MTINSKLQDWLKNQKEISFLLAVSLLLKGWIWALSPVIVSDGPLYIIQANKFLVGDWSSGIGLHGITFLYSALIASLHPLIPDLVIAARLISLFASILTLIPLYSLASGIFGRRTAFLSGLAFALTPKLNLYSASVMRDPIFIFIAVCSVYCAWKAIETYKCRYFIIFPFLSLIAFLLRLEGFLLPIIFFCLLLALIACLKNERKLLTRGLAVFILSTLSVFLPMIALIMQNPANYDRIYDFLVASKDANWINFLFYNPDLKSQLRILERSLLNGIFDNDFAEIAREHIRLIYLIGLMSAFIKAIFPPFFIALITGFFAKPHISRSQLLLLVFSACYLFAAYYFLTHWNFLEIRFIYLPVVLMMLWVGAGLEKILFFLKKKRAGLIIFAIIFFITPVYKSLEATEDPAISVKKAGQWLSRQKGLQGAAIISNDRRIPFYAEQDDNFIFFTTSNPDDFLEMEQTALEQGTVILAIETKKNKLDWVPDFNHFRPVARFGDEKRATLIYKKK